MSLNGKLILGYMPDGTGTMYPFNSVFNYSQNILRQGFDNVDALVLWGGEDISPTYYAQKAHSRNQNQHGPSKRDINEWKAMKYAKMNGIPIIGVCRGAQFLCVFSGGSLIQHVTGHHGEHNVMTPDGHTLMETSSCHHQMMCPWKTDYQLLAWTPTKLSSCYEDQDDLEIPTMLSHVEPEVVFFPKTRGLAIQGHPEWMATTDPFVQWCNEKVVELLLTELEEV